MGDSIKDRSSIMVKLEFWHLTISKPKLDFNNGHGSMAIRNNPRAEQGVRHLYRPTPPRFAIAPTIRTQAELHFS
jgi:hypothetical protein